MIKFSTGSLYKGHKSFCITIGRLNLIAAICPSTRCDIGVTLTIGEGEGIDGLYICLGKKYIGFCPPYISSKGKMRKRV
jgi:hypothetical protein